MGEYFRSENNQIQADLAYRLGKIVLQYEKANLYEKKYEVTLYLSTLQLLLTNCQELYRSMRHNDRRKLSFQSEIKESNNFLGIEKNTIKKDSFFSNSLTIDLYIDHLRNALSHPTHLDLSKNYPSTGYTTIEDGSHIIKAFVFIDSPDTKNNSYKEYPDFGVAEKNLNKMPKTKNIKITKILNSGVKYILTMDDEKPFVRIFEIHLNVDELRSLVLNLSNYLAQPIKNDWDGVSVVPLVA